MYKVKQINPNRIDIKFRGKLDTELMQGLLDELIEKSDAVEHGKMLYRIYDFDWPSLGALGVEFKRLPELFKLVKKFDRIAVLCDTKWIRKAGQIEGALIPGLDIKAFELADEDQAEEWLMNS